MVVVGVCVAGIIVLGLLLTIMFPRKEEYKSPQLYRRATSPDKSWTVEVWRDANDAYPLRDGVAVIVVIKGADNIELKREVIDSRDRWEDIEDRYADVIITNKEIKVGYTWWDGKQHGEDYYRVSKRDL
jgi:hypothetical protein